MPLCRCAPSAGSAACGCAPPAYSDRVLDGYYGAYAVVGLLGLVGLVAFGGSLQLNRLLRPQQPSHGKNATYECGLDPVGAGWAQTQVRYYVFAFLYVVFAVESVFLFPWAVVFARPGFGAGAFVEMLLFLVPLSVALLYAWRKGVLSWT